MVRMCLEEQDVYSYKRAIMHCVMCIVIAEDWSCARPQHRTSAASHNTCPSTSAPLPAPSRLK
jgi:hypothetical protein